MQSMDDNKSSLKIAEDVIAKIVSIAVLETAGVAGFCARGGDAIIGRLNKKAPAKGIRVDVKEASVEIEVSINVRYGVKIQEIGLLVQENVSRAVETMAGLKVEAVNVNIAGIVFDEGAEAEEQKNK